MCRLTEGVLKQFGFQKAEHHSMVCHDWIGARHVLIGENKAFENDLQVTNGNLDVNFTKLSRIWAENQQSILVKIFQT